MHKNEPSFIYDAPLWCNCHNSATSSGSTSNCSFLVICTTSALSFSSELLNPSKSSVKAEIYFSHTHINAEYFNLFPWFTFSVESIITNQCKGTSLVAQWWRIYLPMQGMMAWYLFKELTVQIPKIPHVAKKVSPRVATPEPRQHH